MSELDAEERADLPRNVFAIPAKAPGSGSYPIEDAAHARNALSRVAENGTPEEKAEVREAVHRRYPGIGAEVQGQRGESLHSMADRMHPVRR